MHLFIDSDKILLMKKISKVGIILSIVLSICFLFGYEINKHHVIDRLFYSKNIIKTFFAFIIITFLIYLFIITLYKLLDKLKSDNSNNKLYNFIFEENPLLKIFIIFLIFSLPIIIFYYPGPVHWDGLQELDYFYNIMPISNHHPVFPTLLMGVSMKLGRLIYNDNFGIFLYTFPQLIFSCFTFAYIFKFFKEINTPKVIRVITFLFFLLNPVWYINGYTIVKDTYYYLLFVWFLIYYYKFYFDKSKKNTLLLLLFSLCVVLFRNNGIYIVIASLIIFLFKKSHRKTSLIFIIIFLLFQFGYKKALNYFDVEPSNIRETLSVPIQQSARYIKYYSYEFTDKEKKYVENLYRMSIKDIKKKYDPELSDPVKFPWLCDTKEDLITYFKFWFKGLKKHPKVYIDAFLENYYGYYYPLKKDYKDGVAWFIVVYNKKVNTGYFNLHYLKAFKLERKFITNFTNKLKTTKGIGLVYNTGVYTWLLLILIGYSVYKKRYKNIIFSLPILLTLAFCFLSPVNAYLRYMNPIIVVIPIYLAICLKKEN